IQALERYVRLTSYRLHGYRALPYILNPNGSESGGAHFPPRFFAPFQTRESQNKRSGKKKRKNRESIDPIQNNNPAISHCVCACVLWAFANWASGCPGTGRRLSGLEYG